MGRTLMVQRSVLGAKRQLTLRSVQKCNGTVQQIITLVMTDTLNKVVMPRMRDLVQAVRVEPDVGAALTTAALSIGPPRPSHHPLPEKQTSQKKIERAGREAVRVIGRVSGVPRMSLRTTLASQFFGAHPSKMPCVD